jgi:hypothetical protein
LNVYGTEETKKVNILLDILPTIFTEYDAEMLKIFMRTTLNEWLLPSQPKNI